MYCPSVTMATNFITYRISLYLLEYTPNLSFRYILYVQPRATPTIPQRTTSNLSCYRLITSLSRSLISGWFKQFSTLTS